MRTRSNTRLMTLLVALCAIAAVVAGCGGGDEGDTSDDPRAEIRALVEESIAFEDPATICEENFTEAALKAGYKGNDHAARVEECSKDDPADLGDLDFLRVKVDGDTAKASFQVTIPNRPPLELPVDLRDEDGWKINKVG